MTTTATRKDEPAPAGFSLPVKRTGLHKLRCFDCDLAAYVTFAQLERRQLPYCPCGLELLPERLDVALAVESLTLEDLERHPVYSEYERKVQSVLKGRASTEVRAGNRGERDAYLERNGGTAEEKALAIILEAQREGLAMQRAAGLVQNQRESEPLPF